MEEREAHVMYQVTWTDGTQQHMSPERYADVLAAEAAQIREWGLHLEETSEQPHIAQIEVVAHPLSYPGEERHETREQGETVQRQSFEDRAQALIDRIEALGQTRERGQEIG